MNLGLLFDENLSERLLQLLLDRCPGSQHIRRLGLGGASDLTIWQLAAEQNSILLTKDEDILVLSMR